MDDLSLFGFAFILSLTDDLLLSPKKSLFQNWFRKSSEFFFQSGIVFLFYSLIFLFIHKLPYSEAFSVSIFFLPAYLLLKWRKTSLLLMLTVISFSWMLYTYSANSFLQNLVLFLKANFAIIFLWTLLEGLKHKIFFSDPTPSWKGLPIYTLSVGLLAFIWVGMKTALMF